MESFFSYQESESVRVRDAEKYVRPCLPDLVYHDEEFLHRLDNLRLAVFSDDSVVLIVCIERKRNCIGLAGTWSEGSFTNVSILPYSVLTRILRDPARNSPLHCLFWQKVNLGAYAAYMWRCGAPTPSTCTYRAPWILGSGLYIIFSRKARHVRSSTKVGPEQSVEGAGLPGLD